jgi:hypothetical protein
MTYARWTAQAKTVRKAEGCCECGREPLLAVRRLWFPLHLPAGLCDMRMPANRCGRGRFQRLSGAWKELM